MSVATDTQPLIGTGAATGARVVALIAAHNEEAAIGAALQSLAGQRRPPDEVIVVADRCTDRTAEIAAAHGAKVLETFGNQNRNAGALKQALKVVLTDLNPSDQVLLMKADTGLDGGFLATGPAIDWILGDTDPDLGGIAERDRVSELLAALPPSERMVLGMRIFGAMPLTQIAAWMGISPARVCELLETSLEYLRDRLP